MVIDGKSIADRILSDLKTKNEGKLHTGYLPTLRVILIGNNPASLSYIKQKQKAALTIGAYVDLIHNSTFTKNELSIVIENSNRDPAVHGLIVQRPIPSSLGDVSSIIYSILPSKDVDGLVPASKFDPPVALAVIKILEHIYKNSIKNNSIDTWLRAQHITIIGRGETAGKPIYDLLKKKGCTTSVIHSQTSNGEEILNTSDIIISCVGKKRVVVGKQLRQGVILISVGIWRDADGKLHGDYEPEDIEPMASFYTPTPGGVGPVNVACLMENLLTAFQAQTL